MSEPTTTGSQQKVCKTDHCNHHDHSVKTNVEPTSQIHHASCIEGIRREILSKDNLFESARKLFCIFYLEFIIQRETFVCDKMHNDNRL